MILQLTFWLVVVVIVGAGGYCIWRMFATQKMLPRLPYGFLFSVPCAVVFLGTNPMSKSMSNELELAVIALALVVALPWSIAAGVLFLLTYSPQGTGTTTDLLLRGVGMAVFLIGAHFNGLLFFSPSGELRDNNPKQQALGEAEPVDNQVEGTPDSAAHTDAKHPLS